MSKVPQTPASKLRVLVVDDDPDIVVEIAEAFGRAGCTAFSARSGRAAEAVFGRETVDVLLTDIRMPDGSGIDLLKWLATSGHAPLAFVMTGYDDFQMEDALRHGAVGLFSKPFEVALIVATVLEQARRPR